MISKNIKQSLKKNYKENPAYIDYIFRELCREGNLAVVKYIFSHSLYRSTIQFDHSNANHDSPLVLASCNGHFHVVKFLLENKDNLFVINDNKNRAILLACHNGHLKIVKYLLHSKKIKINAIANYFCLNYAYERKFNNVVQYLLEHYEIKDLNPLPDYTHSSPERITMFENMRNSLILCQKLIRTMSVKQDINQRSIKI